MVHVCACVCMCVCVCVRVCVRACVRFWLAYLFFQFVRGGFAVVHGERFVGLSLSLEHPFETLQRQLLELSRRRDLGRV